jgi:hypothetical protein
MSARTQKKPTVAIAISLDGDVVIDWDAVEQIAMDYEPGSNVNEFPVMLCHILREAKKQLTQPVTLH